MHLNKLYHLQIYTFILTIHLAIIVYVGSTFLSGIFGRENIWLIYTISAFLTLLLNFSIIPLLRNFKIEKINKIALIVAGVNLLFMWQSTFPFNIFISYILYIVLTEYLTMLSSIMVEDLSKNSTTGSTRGIFISMQSLAYILGPFLAFISIKYFGLSSLFLISALFIFLSIIYFHINIKNLPIINVPKKYFFSSLKTIWKNYDIRNSVFAIIALNVFFMTSTVFIPFKMESVGISLTTYLSVLLPIALLPFLFLPKILGYIEDKMRDEKLFIIIGITGLLLILTVFAFVNSSSLILWALILFVSRIFASITETSVNSYFFKKISESETATISVFTSTNPIAALIFQPILGVILYYGNLQTVFLSVSFFLCFMLILVSKIHNTDNYDKHKSLTEIFHRSKRRVSN